MTKRMFGSIALAVVGLSAPVLLLVYYTRPSGTGVDSIVQRSLQAERNAEPQQARSIIDDGLKQFPNSGELLLLRAHYAHTDGDSSLALQLLDRVPEQPTWLAGSARFSAATIFREQNKLRDAQSRWEQSCQLLKDPEPAWVELIKLHWLRMQKTQSRYYLEQLRQRRPWSLEELVMYLLAGRIGAPFDDHIGQLEKAVAADPKDCTSATALASYLIFARDPQPAKEQIAQLLPALRDCAQLQALYLEICLRIGDMDMATKMLRALEESETAVSLVWRARGTFALNEGHVRQALMFLMRAWEQDPDDPDSNYQISLALARLNDVHAKTFAERAVSLRELSTDLHGLQHAAANAPTGLPSKIAAVLNRLSQLDRNTDSQAIKDWYERSGLALRFGPIPAQEQHQGVQISALREHLQSLAASATETVRTGTRMVMEEDRPRRVPYVDVAPQVGIDFHFDNGSSDELFIIETIGGGIAVLDYDQNGWPDLFFAQGAALSPSKRSQVEPSNRMYSNLGEHFTDVTEVSQLRDVAYSTGCAAADFDNDGDPDLLVTNVGLNAFYRNNGDGTFSEITEQSGIDDQGISSSAAFADFDGDGDLDLFLSNYVAEMPVCTDRDGMPVVCHPRDLQPARCLVYENLGDGRFADISTAAGVDVPDAKSLGVVVVDFDRDGKPDVYVSNDTTPNFVFHNITEDGGPIRFEEIGLGSGAAVDRNGLAQAGMGIAVEDFDRNGLLDLYVTNFYADINTMYRNLGQLVFSDDTVAVGLAEPTRPLLGFGTQAVDADLDGWPDLLVLNGHIADNRKHGEPYKMRPQFFWNQGGNFVEQFDGQGGFFDQQHLGRGLSVLDFNRDGRQDLIATFLDRNAALLTDADKQAVGIGQVLIVELVGKRATRDASNTLVDVRMGDRQLASELWTGGYLGCNEPVVLFGLRDQQQVDELSLRWQSRRHEQQLSVSAGRHLFVEPLGE